MFVVKNSGNYIIKSGKHYVMNFLKESWLWSFVACLEVVVDQEVVEDQGEELLFPLPLILYF